MNIELLIAVTHGLIVGTLFGCIPGLGVLAAVLFSMPFLFEYSMMSLVIFYLALIISTQYTGSVVATFLGIPGELTSAPAAKVGYALHRRGHGSSAIIAAALGSAMATIIATIALYFGAEYLSTQAWIHRSVIYVSIILFVMGYLCFINRYWLINFLLVMIGLCLGSLGNKHGLQELNFTFGQEWLEQGLIMPMIVIVAFVIPNLWTETGRIGNVRQLSIPSNTLALNLYLLVKTRWAILRGSLVGCISGLIPGIGTSVSSNMSWSIEKSMKSSALQQLVSAESANNSAMISSLVPLILFGIPILASEGLILEIMESHGEAVGIMWFTGLYEESIFSRLQIFSFFALIISAVMYVIATYFAIAITKTAASIPPYCFKFLLPIIMVTFFVIKGYVEYQLISTLFTVVLCVPIMSWAIRKKINTLPLIFSALLAPILFEKGSVVLALFTNIW